MSDVSDPTAAAAVDTFGGFLRTLRLRLKLRQVDLVAEIKMSGATAGALSHWEDGRRTPLPPQLLAIVRALGPSDKETVRLLELAAQKDRRYDGLIQSWVASGLVDPVEQVRVWEAWAVTFQPHPPRGKSWR